MWGDSESACKNTSDYTMHQSLPVIPLLQAFCVRRARRTPLRTPLRWGAPAARDTRETPVTGEYQLRLNKDFQFQLASDLVRSSQNFVPRPFSSSTIVLFPYFMPFPIVLLFLDLLRVRLFINNDSSGCKYTQFDTCSCCSVINHYFGIFY
jgi:hypothetical protein